MSGENSGLQWTRRGQEVRKYISMCGKVAVEENGRVTQRDMGSKEEIFF